MRSTSRPCCGWPGTLRRLPGRRRFWRSKHAIAQAQESLADSEVVQKANNLWTLADFEAKAPGLDWSAYFGAAGLAQQREFYVWQPSAFTGESALVASMPLATWKDWMAFHLLEQYGPFLSRPFEQETFNFEGKVLVGVPQQEPRWKRAVDLVNAELGDAVGQLYASKYFPPQAKAEAQDMVAHLIAAYHKRLEALTWLAPSTKAEALKKLDSLYVGIGYPETWKDYSAYAVEPGDLFGNVWRAQLFKYRTTSTASANRSTGTNGGWSRRRSTQSTCRCRMR